MPLGDEVRYVTADTPELAAQQVAEALAAEMRGGAHDPNPDSATVEPVRNELRLVRPEKTDG